MELNSQKKKNHSIRKWAEDLNRYFSKEDHSGGQEVNAEMLNITNHQENANQNLKIITSCLSNWLLSKRQNDESWRGYGEKGTLVHCWWEL